MKDVFTSERYWASHYEIYDEETEWAEWLCDYCGPSLDEARKTIKAHRENGYEVMLREWDGDKFIFIP